MSIGQITSPITWLIGTVVPPAWLQAVQDNINGLIAGTGPTMKALQVDGIGGAASTQASGTLSVSAALSGTSGAVPAYSQGTLSKDIIPFAGGFFNLSPTGTPTVPSFVKGWNISNSSPITRSSAGIYTINLASSVPNINTAAPSVTYCNVQQQNYPALVGANMVTASSVQVNFWNSSGTSVDSGINSSVMLLVWGL